MAPRYCTDAEAERWERLGLPLDRYGETDVFACLQCGAPSLKVSVPVHAAHCTGCGWSPKDVTVAARLEERARHQPAPDGQVFVDVGKVS